MPVTGKPANSAPSQPSDAGALHAPAATHAAYCALLTSSRISQKASTSTTCAGPSSGLPSSEPMVNSPPGMNTYTAPSISFVRCRRPAGSRPVLVRRRRALPSHLRLQYLRLLHSPPQRWRPRRRGLRGRILCRRFGNAGVVYAVCVGPLVSFGSLVALGRIICSGRLICRCNVARRWCRSDRGLRRTRLCGALRPCSGVAGNRRAIRDSRGHRRLNVYHAGFLRRRRGPAHELPAKQRGERQSHHAPRQCRPRGRVCSRRQPALVCGRRSRLTAARGFAPPALRRRIVCGGQRLSDQVFHRGRRHKRPGARCGRPARHTSARRQHGRQARNSIRSSPGRRSGIGGPAANGDEQSIRFLQCGLRRRRQRRVRVQAASSCPRCRSAGCHRAPA